MVVAEGHAWAKKEGEDFAVGIHNAGRAEGWAEVLKSHRVGTKAAEIKNQSNAVVQIVGQRGTAAIHGNDAISVALRHGSPIRVA